MPEVAAAMMTAGVFACVISGPTDRAAGVMPKPASTSTLLPTNNSWAMRLVCSGTPLEDNFHRAASDGAAVLGHIQANCGVNLPTRGGKRAGHRQNQPDFEWRRRLRPGGGQTCGQQGGSHSPADGIAPM